MDSEKTVLNTQVRKYNSHATVFFFHYYMYLLHNIFSINCSFLSIYLSAGPIGWINEVIVLIDASIRKLRISFEFIENIFLETCNSLETQFIVQILSMKRFSLFLPFVNFVVLFLCLLLLYDCVLVLDFLPELLRALSTLYSIIYWIAC